MSIMDSASKSFPARICRAGQTLFHRFKGDQSGGVAMPAGILIVALTTGVGMSVDYSRAMKAQKNLQDAVDAAVIAATSRVDLDEGEVAANVLFDSTYMANNRLESVTRVLTEDGRNRTYSVEAEVPTVMLQLVGKGSLSVNASATASRGVGSAEIVLALDTTGSMGFGSSWEQATSAVSDLLVDFDNLAVNDEEFYATFFPYGDRVNVGRDRAEGWLSGPVPTEDQWGKYTNGSGDLVHTGKGCLEPREEMVDGNPHALTTTTPDTLGFVPTSEGNYLSYLPERGGFTCPDQAVIGPTRNISSFSEAIEGVGLSGTGRFDLGMAWAHRMLSPDWQGLWGVPGYPSARGERQKIAILVTDMFTNAYHYEVPYQISDTANTPNFGHNRGTQMGFDNFAEVCDRMKEDGIIIHTVYVNGNPHGVPFMEACATSPAHFHSVSNVSELRNSLNSITGSVLGVRLTN